MLGYFPSSPPSPPISCIFCAAFFWAFSIASFRQSRRSLYSSPFILTEWIFLSAESSTCALPFSSLLILCFSAFCSCIACFRRSFNSPKFFNGLNMTYHLLPKLILQIQYQYYQFPIIQLFKTSLIIEIFVCICSICGICSIISISPPNLQLHLHFCSGFPKISYQGSALFLFHLIYLYGIYMRFKNEP